MDEDLYDRANEAPSQTLGLYNYTWTLLVDGKAIHTKNFTVADMGYEEDEWDQMTDAQRRGVLDDFPYDEIEARWKATNIE